MPRRDEDALSWDGDDDPTLDTGAPAPAEDPAVDTIDGPAALPDGWTPVGRGSDGLTHPDEHAAAAPHTPPPLPTESPAVAVNGTTAPAESVAPATVVSDASPQDTADEGLGTAALVSIGVLGGVYLLFAIGWLIGGLRLQGRYQVLVTDAMYQGALWLATAAPLIWFATTLFATRKTRAWVRWLWLVFGALLLIPWPFLMIGAVGR